MKLEYTIQGIKLLRDFLKEIEISDKLLADIKSKGDLLVNGQHVTVRYELQIGDQLEILFPKEERGKQLEASFEPLDIVYEDDYLLVINKPANIPCIPDHRYHEDTLANRIIGYYQINNIDSTIHFVNRLDVQTGGLLIVAKYRYIHSLLSKSHIHRKYLALVYGTVESQTIDLPIYREGISVKRCIDQRGKVSVTHIHPLHCSGDLCLVDCELETGRTHQIRVHLSAIGHPLIGDRLYDGLPNEANQYYLHSYTVKFTHPITKEEKAFEKIREIDESIKKTL